MADEITLSEFERITDAVGVSWYDITDQGRLRIQIQETGTSSIDTILDETLDAGKVWRVRISISITESDV